MYSSFFKRAIDIILSLGLLIFLSPILILVSFLLWLDYRGSPFFLQRRPGKANKLFFIIKFKTMNDERDSKGNLVSSQQRITKIGKWLRKTSIDEIPQLLNVLKGDMSIVGPRPLLEEYLPLYSQSQLRRHHVKPGVTGLAQVNGRNSIGWEEKFEYDIYYVDHVSFFMDLKILYLTMIKVISLKNVNASDTITMEKFKG